MAKDKYAIIPITTETQVETVVSLAEQIWTQHYTPIIGTEQVSYMLHEFQSALAIKEQMNQGYLYFTLQTDSPVGYLALQAQEDVLFISKIYLKLAARGQGYGKLMMQHAENIATNLGCRQLRLTVNRNNIDTIKSYEKLGFEKVREVVFDIGNGYVMDDFEMVKILEKT